jgi:hypothetical protein
VVFNLDEGFAVNVRLNVHLDLGGELVSLRFLEWAIAHPDGIIALPTGRTPEYFIKTMEKLKATWTDAHTQAKLIKYGFSEDSLAEFPTLSGLTFVMLDEFFPMSPKHRNSFCNYIELFYISMMNIDPQKVLKFDLIEAGILTETEINLFNDIDVDLSLLSKDIEEVTLLSAERQLQRSILMKVEQYCQQFEARVRALGGIGFFLGGTEVVHSFYFILFYLIICFCCIRYWSRRSYSIQSTRYSVPTRLSHAPRRFQLPHCSSSS